MTIKTLANVMWVFPQKLFNIGREKIAKIVRDRAQSEARWLNG
ncbi:MAG: hypothetical protein QM805_11685 [Pseudomonas sp.]